MKIESLPFIVNKNSVTMVYDSKSYNVHATHKNYDKIVECLHKKKYKKALKYADILTEIQEYTSGNIDIKNGTLYYKDRPIKTALSQRIIKMYQADLPLDAMLKFLENLMLNPSNSAVNELYLFLEENKLPITDDGHFLAYKNVTSDYLDIRTKSIDNSIGSVVKMDRNAVCDKRDITCAPGLHFCALSYLRSYNVTNGHTMILKVNPKDVVSIPNDYNNAKGRCCEYTVYAEHNSMEFEAHPDEVVVKTEPYTVPATSTGGTKKPAKKPSKAELQQRQQKTCASRRALKSKIDSKKQSSTRKRDPKTGRFM